MIDKKNICPICGGDIDALKEMFPQGWTTCEELIKKEVEPCQQKLEQHGN